MLLIAALMLLIALAATGIDTRFNWIKKRPRAARTAGATTTRRF